MSALVLLHHNEPMTTSETLAEGVAISHKSVLQLLRKYVADLSEWGEVAFQMRLNPQGSPTEFAYLNEGQAMFLLTLMRNSPVVVAFKKALVKAFLELRDRVAVLPAPTFATGNLGHGADLAVAADRTFRGFLRAARSAGMRLPAALRTANAQTIARTGMDMLAELGVVPDPEPEAPHDALAEALGAWVLRAEAGKTYHLASILSEAMGWPIDDARIPRVSSRAGKVLRGHGFDRRQIRVDGERKVALWFLRGTA